MCVSRAVIRVFRNDYLLSRGCCVAAEAADAKQAQVATEPGGPVMSQSIIRLYIHDDMWLGDTKQ